MIGEKSRFCIDQVFDTVKKKKKKKNKDNKKNKDDWNHITKKQKKRIANIIENSDDVDSIPTHITKEMLKKSNPQTRKNKFTVGKLLEALDVPPFDIDNKDKSDQTEYYDIDY
jgi:hypothetical protein